MVENQVTGFSWRPWGHVVSLDFRAARRSRDHSAELHCSSIPHHRDYRRRRCTLDSQVQGTQAQRRSLRYL